MRKNIPSRPGDQSRDPEPGYATNWPRPANDNQRESELEKAMFRQRHASTYERINATAKTVID